MSNQDLDKNIAILFGSDFSNLDEAALSHVYVLVRKKLRDMYEKSKPVSFKVCQKCNSTFPRVTLSCSRCGNDRLDDVPYPIGDKFTKADDIYDNEQIRKELDDAIKGIIRENLPHGFKDSVQHGIMQRAIFLKIQELLS